VEGGFEEVQGAAWVLLDHGGGQGADRGDGVAAGGFPDRCYPVRCEICGQDPSAGGVDDVAARFTALRAVARVAALTYRASELLVVGGDDGVVELIADVV